MSVLSDRDIRNALQEGRVRIDPFDPACLQPSSVDLHLDREFRVFHNHRHPIIDPRVEQPDLTEVTTIDGDEPFILHPGEFVLGQTLEWVELPDDLVARLEGKALALDTPVPTPLGWRTMGEIEPGDHVFDEHGSPTLVVDATAPMTGRPCREVIFSDGQRVIADAAHQWVTVDRNGRHGGRMVGSIRTTDEIARTVRVRGELNHQVPLAGPVQYPHRLDLPIEPYTLGAWLGDGTTTAGTTTAGTTTAGTIICFDDRILERISGDGYAVRRMSPGRRLYGIGGPGRARHARSGRFTSVDSLSTRLRGLGLMDGKSIPRRYLEAGVGQRRALLEGLMDTGGFVDGVAGRCEFASTCEALADGVVELAASLGYRAVKAVGRARLHGVGRGPTYRVRSTPDRPVVRLDRKRTRRWTPESRFHRFRSIDVVRPVPSVPVRCIQVASPSGQYLVSRSFIPTHNSSLGRLGLLIHSTAGYVDPGWKGNLTLELSNVARLPIALYHGMRIGQISFFAMSSPVERPYGTKGLGSRYQGQSTPTASGSYRDFEAVRRTIKGGPRR